jgi:hypothetical protein
MGSHAVATGLAVGGEVRDRLEQPSPLSLQWQLEMALQSVGMMQSLAHRVDEVGIAATAGDMAIAMTPMLPEAMAVVSSGGEDSGAIVGLVFAVVETVAMGAVRQPGGAAGAAGLEARAGQVHGALDSIAAKQRTTAVLRTSGDDFVAGGARDLTPAQRALLGPGETAARLQGAHAEVTALRAAEGAGVAPRAIGVTRPICPSCKQAIEASGGRLTSPTTAVWE